MVSGIINNIFEYIQKNATHYKVKERLFDTYVSVYSNEYAAIKWIKNFHLGYFNKYENDLKSNYFIYGLFIKNNVFRIILKELEFGKSIEMFFEHNGYFTKKEDVEIYYDLESEYIHFLCKEYNYLIINNHNADNIRVLERIMREIFFGTNNYISCRTHAASLYDGSKGVLVVGCKGSGKTSLLLGALLKGAMFGSNDRTEIFLDEENNLKYCGVPTSVRLSREQIQYLQDIKGTMLKQKDFKDLGEYKGKFEYTPQEMVKYLNVAIGNHQIVKCIIIPEFEKKELKIQKIEKQGLVYDILFQNIMLKDKAFRRYFLMEKSSIDTRDRLIEEMMKLRIYIVSGWLYDFDLRMIQ